MPSNALEVMDSLLVSERDQAEMLAVMRSNLGVVMTGCVITPERLKRYLGWVRDGLDFVRQMMGIRCIPPRILFCAKPPFAHWKYHFCVYLNRSDGASAIAIGLARVAIQAAFDDDDELVEHDHEGISGPLCARTRVMLEVIEECFHYYQFQYLKYPVSGKKDITGDRDHPVEIEWRAYRDKLIKDGFIVCRPAHDA